MEGRHQVDTHFNHPEWTRNLTGEWKHLLGLHEHRPPADPSMRIISEREMPTHRRIECAIKYRGAIESPATLLIPHNLVAPTAGVLAIHGHGPGRDYVTGAVDSDNNNDYARLLVDRGYVVLAPDITNFGDRRDPLDLAGRYDRERCDVQFLRGVAAGIWPVSHESSEWRSWVDALISHPLVDPARIGALGLSLGGRTTGMCAALDPRVRAAVVSGSLNTLRERFLFGQGCVKNLVPGLLALADLPDLYALIAPRPLFLELGADDTTSPEIFAQEAYRRIHTAYRAVDADNDLGIHVFDGGHRFNGERSLPWLDEKLNL